MKTDTRTLVLRIVAGAVFLLLFFQALQLLDSVAVMVLTSFALAYIMNPLVVGLKSHGISRALSSAIVILAVLLVIVMLLVITIPAISGELAAFSRKAPAYFEVIQKAFLEVADKLNIQVPRDWEEFSALLAEKGRQMLPKIADLAGKMTASIFGSAMSILGTIFKLIMIPLITYYILASFDDIKQGIADLIPPYVRKSLFEKIAEIDTILSAFVRGQLTIAVILVFLYCAGFILIGIDLALVIGILSGILFVVPYVGTSLALILGSLMAFATYGDAIHAVYVIGWVALVQGLESNVLTPKIVGEAVGLHPLVYILVLIVGANLFGFMGLILAIPVAASAKVLLAVAVKAYQESSIYKDHDSETSSQ
jgi:predicted PurR-regulated permease PerM